jgi:hypothetical protein
MGCAPRVTPCLRTGGGGQGGEGTLRERVGAREDSRRTGRPLPADATADATCRAGAGARSPHDLSAARGSRRGLGGWQERMLTKDLATVKRDREKAAKARDAHIAALEAEREELAQMTATAGKAVGEGSGAQAQQEHEEAVAELEKQLEKLKVELEKASKENQDKEEQMKKRSYKKETDVETWVQKYDQEMTELNKETAEVAEQYAREKAKVRIPAALAFARGGSAYACCWLCGPLCSAAFRVFVICAPMTNTRKYRSSCICLRRRGGWRTTSSGSGS